MFSGYAASMVAERRKDGLPGKPEVVCVPVLLVSQRFFPNWCPWFLENCVLICNRAIEQEVCPVALPTCLTQDRLCRHLRETHMQQALGPDDSSTTAEDSCTL